MGGWCGYQNPFPSPQLLLTSQKLHSACVRGLQDSPFHVASTVPAVPPRRVRLTSYWTQSSQPFVVFVHHWLIWAVCSRSPFAARNGKQMHCTLCSPVCAIQLFSCLPDNEIFTACCPNWQMANKNTQQLDVCSGWCQLYFQHTCTVWLYRWSIYINSSAWVVISYDTSLVQG